MFRPSASCGNWATI